MRDSLAKFGSWGRKALMLAALAGVPALAAAPAAEARTVPAVMVQGGVASGADALLVPAQWGPPRPYYYGPRHWHRPPPPPHWRRHGWRHGYGYGPPPRYYGPRYGWYR